MARETQVRDEIVPERLRALRSDSHFLRASSDREWVRDSILSLRADEQRSADTHLFRLDLPEAPHAEVYLKDESIHPSGSLKHRLARSLFLHALCGGALHRGMTVVEASSGSTAISEAFFARLIGLPMIAVIPSSTASAKQQAIEAMGAKLVSCAPHDDPCAIAAGLAREMGGLFLDQFTNAERVTDWRGNNNIAESLFDQLRLEPHPIPTWVVVGAGTGGTSATIGRYVRYRPELAATRICVVDPPGSAFFPAFTGLAPSTPYCRGVVEGIGRFRVEPSFMPEIIDLMVEVPDSASVSAARWLAERTGRRYGPSTGANLMGVFTLVEDMRVAGAEGSLVTLACDNGERYANTIYSDAWVTAHGLDLRAWDTVLRNLAAEDPRPWPTFRKSGRGQQAEGFQAV